MKGKRQGLNVKDTGRQKTIKGKRQSKVTDNYEAV